VTLALLIGALLWAISAPQRSRWLRNYLYAQALYIPAVWGAWYLVGDSRAYLYIYAAFTVTILVMVFCIALERWTEPVWKIFWASGLVALSVFLPAAIQLPHPSGGQQIQILEASALAFAGAMVGFSAPWHKDRAISVTLSLFWLTQAMMRVGFVWHIDEAWWLFANEWMHGAAGIVAFGCIGWFLWHPREAA
jgi:hypothetical protein